ncbi:MAG: ABC transporter permease [Paludibacterium sp.]|uniref:ABC transporter permease n=1 Tax=Paludibacterium sp. TaxID=1917523 RepID=UPI0025F45F20|nr:ABC transporter permease [Paludibacterium sp.]MBV8045993.1 ABC transporter permease [Paludibacterium sp.]MBV8647333.1 ABC transporter permease [Paludibacterium sp.]
MQGFLTLLKKELVRFWKVSFQTVAAPVLTALLYQLIFAHAMASHIEVYAGVSYATFLIPGLAMMSMTQNAFANGSSSLIQSKITGNIVFLLLPPLTALDFFAAYLLAAIVRGLVVGLGVLVITAWFGLPWPAHPLWVLLFATLGCGALGALGVVAGIWAEKFDQLAAFQNFLIMPLTFLSGVFYSINSLPPFWKAVSHFNPVFYMIDGFRYGFFAQSDTDPWLALGVVGLSFIVISALALALIKSGYRLRH